MSFRLWLESAAPRLYIRFGSLVGSSECKLGKEFDRQGECGLSVYGARRLTGDPLDWHIEDIKTFRRVRGRKDTEFYELEFPDSRHAIYSVGHGYWRHMMEQFGCQGRYIYLLTGERVGWDVEHPEREGTYRHEPMGADGEPLLDGETVKVIKQLEADQIFAGGRLVDEYCTYGWHDPHAEEE